MTKELRTIAAIFLPLFTLALGWQLGMRTQAQALQQLEDRLALEYSGGTGSTVVDPEKDVDLSLLWATWRLLLKHYVAPENIKTQDMLFGAVRGMTASIGDPYTLFMTPKENDDFRNALSGSLEGIGAELAMKDGKVTVVAPIRKSPAERAGILPGDWILSVNGEDTDGKTLQEVVQSIRGPRGTKVTLEIARGEPPDVHDIVIIRENIHVPSVEWRLEGEGDDAIPYVAVNQFGDETIAELKEALLNIPKQTDARNLKGLVLDLRNNGGGYLDGAIDMVSLFQRQGKVVSVERREGALQSDYVSGRPLLPDTPMVVLINGGSASAAEIVAGALFDNKRATLMGEKSFGKGTVQEVIDLPGGSSLRVTVARWLTPSGHDLSKQGITPEYVLPTPATPVEGVDPQLQAALEFLRTGKKPTGR